MTLTLNMNFAGGFVKLAKLRGRNSTYHSAKNVKNSPKTLKYVVD